ncbi:hypothetical protein EYF80_062881 [Liparis tanakae]|uniref:Uncharacterized protein n=1 Tax=Liparis tanakae TaxID=230148 RepID=A0A4Z2EDL8_9TELE|nr:hypothetical protein EYF80_062881 [Liparis tanakae]
MNDIPINPLLLLNRAGVPAAVQRQLQRVATRGRAIRSVATDGPMMMMMMLRSSSAPGRRSMRADRTTGPSSWK